MVRSTLSLLSQTLCVGSGPKDHCTSSDLSERHNQFVLVCVCKVHVCVHALRACVRVCACVCVRVCRVSASVPFPLIFLRLYLSLKLHHTTQAGLAHQKAPGIPPVSVFLVLRVQVCATTSSFLHACWNPSSGPQACTSALYGLHDLLRPAQLAFQCNRKVLIKYDVVSTLKIFISAT